MKFGELRGGVLLKMKDLLDTGAGRGRRGRGGLGVKMGLRG